MIGDRILSNKIFVKDIVVDEGRILNEIFLVRNTDIREGNNGRKHFYMTLSDVTGDIQAVKWSLNPSEVTAYSRIKIGDIIDIRFTCKEWMGKKQLTVSNIVHPVTSEINKADFFKAAPEKPGEMYAYILGKINSFQDEDLQKICKYFYEVNKDRLMYYPAARSNHHAEYAGLLYHVKRMMMTAERVCEVYTKLNKELLMAGVALHDIEKLNEIQSDENGVSDDYSLEGKMLGHLVMGVWSIGDVSEKLGINKEKALMLQHMSLSHHYEPEFGSPIRPLFPEAEMLHYLDIMDAKMFDMEQALNYVKPGEFTDKVFTLDNRKLYQKNF